MNWPQLLLSFIAGAVTVLGFAPFDYFLLPFFSLAILFSIWINQTPGHAARQGYFFGLGLFSVGTFWIHVSIDQFGGVPYVAAVILALLFAAFISLYPALAGWLSAKVIKRFQLSIAKQLLLVFPSVWVLAELTRAYFLTGFPWLSLGYSQVDSVLAGAAPYLGVFGVSWLVALVAAGLVIMLKQKQTGKQLTTTVFIAGIFMLSYGLSNQQQTNDSGKSLDVRIVQGNVPQEIKWHPDYRASTIDLYQKLSFAEKADLVVWPETAVPAFYDEVENYLIKPLAEKLVSRGSEMVIGIPVREKDGRYFNSMVSLGSEFDRYDKRHLVPFGEYAPVEFLLRPLVDYFRIPMSDFAKGTSQRPLLKVGDYFAGVSICYEDAFGNETAQSMPDAAYLINVSNDAWFGDSLAPYQHLQIARMRAIETGRDMIRATNTGISAIVDYRGKVLQESAQASTEVLQGKIQLRQGTTFYSRYQDWPILIMAVLLILIALLDRVFVRLRH